MTNTTLVIDTNLWISYIFGKNVRKSIDKILRDPSITIILDEMSLKEIDEVLKRPKFKKYITEQEIEIYIQLIHKRSILITTSSVFEVCRDVKDNFLLNLAHDGNADFLLTGDEDLLVLVQFFTIKIQKLNDFMVYYYP